MGNVTWKEDVELKQEKKKLMNQFVTFATDKENLHSTSIIISR